MPTITKVFVDTNVFVALSDERDSTHGKAISLKDKLKIKAVKLFTSSDVIGETLTVMSKKLGKKKAVDFFNKFKDYGIKEIFISEDIHKEARKFFAGVKSKNVSFIDCSSAIVMKKYKIEAIFSFDEDFKILGVKLIGEIL